MQRESGWVCVLKMIQGIPFWKCNRKVRDRQPTYNVKFWLIRLTIGALKNSTMISVFIVKLYVAINYIKIPFVVEQRNISFVGILMSSAELKFT